MSITLIILISTALVSVLAFGNRILFDKLMFYPYTIKRNGEHHRFFTHAFIHGDWIHLLMNMYVLYVFGSVVESTFTLIFAHPGFYFLALYIGGILFSSVYSFLKHRDNVAYSAIGASGAVSSLVFAFIVMYPSAGMMIFPLPIQIPSWIFGGLYLVFSWYMARRNDSRIGHDAHFFGAVFGVLFIFIMKPQIVLSFFSRF